MKAPLLICDNLLLSVFNKKVVGYEFEATNNDTYDFRLIEQLDSNRVQGNLDLTTLQCDDFNSVLVYDRETKSIRKFEYMSSRDDWHEIVLEKSYTGQDAIYVSEKQGDYLMLLNKEEGQIIQTIVTRSVYELYHWLTCEEQGKYFTDIKATELFTAAKCGSKVYVFNNKEPSYANLDQIVDAQSDEFDYDIISDDKFSFLYIRSENKVKRVGFSNKGKLL